MGCCENKMKHVQNCTEFKGAKLRDSVRNRFAIASDVSQTKFFPVIKPKVS